MPIARIERAQLVVFFLLLLVPVAIVAGFGGSRVVDLRETMSTARLLLWSGAGLTALALAAIVVGTILATPHTRLLLLSASAFAASTLLVALGLIAPALGGDSTVTLARASLIGGSVGIAAVAADFNRPQRSTFAHAQPWRVVAVAAVAAVAVMLAANAGLLRPWREDSLARLAAVIAVALLLFAAWRFYLVYAVSQSLPAGSLAVGFLFLAESALVGAESANEWTAWQGFSHALAATGFAVPLLGIGIGAVRARSLVPVVESLFLRDVVELLKRSFPDAIGAMIVATEARSGYLRGHSDRVGSLAAALAREIEPRLSPVEIRTAGLAGLLHDVGKIATPDAILLKPGPLTIQEAMVLHEHPGSGARMVSHVPSLKDVAPAIRAHHERLDGGGYPDGLREDAIPLAARIVAVADVWDALTTDRPYRAALSVTEAKRELAREAGAHLDHRCVAALFAVLDRQEANQTRLEGHSATAPAAGD